MSRKTARDLSFKLVFEYEFNQVKNPLTLEDFLVLENLTNKDQTYIKATYDGVVENYSEIINFIEKNLKDYALKRIYKVDLAILILAVYEIKFNAEIEAGVAINEAVELSKKYSTDKSFSFINGVLASIVKEGTNE